MIKTFEEFDLNKIWDPTGYLRKKIKQRKVDPYGEETWEDEKVGVPNIFIENDPTLYRRKVYIKLKKNKFLYLGSLKINELTTGDLDLENIKVVRNVNENDLDPVANFTSLGMNVAIQLDRTKYVDNYRGNKGTYKEYLEKKYNTKIMLLNE